MKSKTVRLNSTRWIDTPADRNDLIVYFDVIDTDAMGSREEASSTVSGQLLVGISRTLQSMWKLDFHSLEKILVEYAKQHLQDRITDNALQTEEELQLSTYNAPDQSPYPPDELTFTFPILFDVVLPSIPSNDQLLGAAIAFAIVDLRDNINAIFGEKYGGRLLSLPQERALIDLGKECKSFEEFVYRAASICGLATSIDTRILNANLDQPAGGGSLDSLGTFLRSEFSSPESNLVMEALSKFNHLRRLYPVHSDRATGVIKALAYFDIEYPIDDYNVAWESIRRKYHEALQRLLTLLRGNEN